MSTLAPWLKAHLIANGHLSPTGVGRRVQPRRCPGCRHDTLVGSDDEDVALEIRVDPTPLSALGEALALVAEAGRYVLWARDSWRITGCPAGTQSRHDVLREHRCHTPAPAGPLEAPTSFASARTRPLPAGSPPPF